jgi:hypothetical protein
VWWGGAVPYDRQLSPPKTHPPPPVQLLVAVRSPVRPPPPSLATESPQQLGKARGEESHGFGELGSPAAKSGGIGNPPEGASGSRRPAAGPRARGRSWAQRRAAEGLMAQSRSPRPPQHAAQSPAGSGPPGRAWLRSVRSPARARSLARFGSVRPGLGAVRGARCAVRGALSPGICRDPSSGREAAGGEEEERGCACAPTSVCEGVSGLVCARGPPARGAEPRAPPAGSPPSPGRSRQLCLPPVPEPSLCLRGPMACVCDYVCVCVCVCVCARARVCARRKEGVCPQRPPPRTVSFGSMLLPLATASSGGTRTSAYTHTYTHTRPELHLTDLSTCLCGDGHIQSRVTPCHSQPYTHITNAHTS